MKQLSNRLLDKFLGRITCAYWISTVRTWPSVAWASDGARSATVYFYVALEVVEQRAHVVAKLPAHNTLRHRRSQDEKLPEQLKGPRPPSKRSRRRLQSLRSHNRNEH